MYTTTEILVYPVALIGFAGALADLMRGRIYNWLTFPAMLIGVIFSVYFSGWAGLADSLLGILAGFLLYGWMFWLRFMGGGDVKLLMALGAFGGWRFTLETALLGVVIGGIIALVIMLFRKRLFGFVIRLKNFVLSVLIKELEFAPPKIDRRFTMPYGPPIAIAATWVALSNPFHVWGLW